MKLKDSKNLLFTTFGQETEVSLQSTFPDPIFQSNFLSNHTINKSGFKANRKILKYNKNVPHFRKNNVNIYANSNLYGLEIKNLWTIIQKSTGQLNICSLS